MRTLAVVFAALSALSLGSVPAFAQPKLSGSPTPTGFSGQSGPTRTLSKPASANEMIFGVEVAERSDDPCFLRAKYRNVQTGAEGSSLKFAECSDNNNNEGTSDSRHTIVLPSYSYTTGARICLDNDRKKMKGIQLIGRYGDCLLGAATVELSRTSCGMLKQGGMEYNLCSNDLPQTPIVRSCSDASTKLSAYFERTNCPGVNIGPDKDWAAEVTCPNGMVVTGMKLSTRDSGGGRTMIDGIALECLRVTEN
jgi:hypothetical protein